ncbi:glycosyltransferase family 2 protein [Clostridium sp.]|uniref:tetratricopeptide repeat-containing glycosyltransferase family 2 protein n=1 Tax=Clostridium sp. TaxID=1506 RepID=UPI002FC9217E
MITLSICLIVKNEERVLKNCLESIHDIVDEIIIADTGSSDETINIAKGYTNKIYDFPWINDFAAARNFSFSKATCDYIFWLDADDILKEEDREKLKLLKRTLDSSYDAVSMKYHYSFSEAGEPTLTFRRNRIVKREKNFKWYGFIHEYIAVEGKILESDINVSHMRVHGNSDRNLNIFKMKIKQGYKLTSRDTYYYGKELYYHGLYDEAISVLSKVVKMDGWYEEKIQTLITLADIYMTKSLFSKCRKYCYEAFDLDTPRAEVLYRIALSYQEEEKYSQAISWYELIPHLRLPMDDSVFIYSEYWTWLPHLQLCVCYYNIGDTKKSFEHNEIARNLNPTNASILQNVEFFKTIDIF